MSVAHPYTSPDRARSLSLAVLLEPWVVLPVAEDRQITGVQVDSRNLSAGDLFIALQGATVNALDYLPEIIESGAVAILVNAEADRPTIDERRKVEAASLALVEIEDLAGHAGEIVGRFYSDPSRSMKVIGVTGTDGKTSVTHMLGQALNEHRDNCGVIGTLGWGFTKALQDTGLTTPDAVTLQSILAGFHDAGAGYAAMEVSSHALSQNRVSGILFDVAVLTNLGRDHLDYHGDMQNYRAAKELLFFQPELRAAVVNADEEFGIGLIGRLTDLELTTYGAEEGGERHVRYTSVQQTSAGLSFEIEFAGQKYPVESRLIGSFNVINLTTTFAVLVALGLSPDLAAQSLSNLKAVPGRMEVTSLKSGASVIVDYAHNPHALESVLKSVVSHLQGSLTVIFGCGGERDQGKRPLMARVAEQYADHCIVTDDNPRAEDGDEIIQHIMSGFTRPQSVRIERDRRRAIESAMSELGAGDLLLVAGKGHEDYQLIGDQRLPFCDSAVVAEYAAVLAS